MKTSPRTFLPSWIQLIKIYLTFPLNILLAIVFNNFLSFFRFAVLMCLAEALHNSTSFTFLMPPRPPSLQPDNGMDLSCCTRDDAFGLFMNGNKLKALEQFNLALSYSSIRNIKKMITKHAKAHYSRLLPPEMCFIKSTSLISKSSFTFLVRALKFTCEKVFFGGARGLVVYTEFRSEHFAVLLVMIQLENICEMFISL